MELVRIMQGVMDYLGPRGPIGSMKNDVSGVRRPARATLKNRKE